MERQNGFALLTAVVIVAFLAAAGLTVYYYKDTVSDKIQEIRQGDNEEVVTVTPLPSDTPAATPTATATPSATPTPTASPSATPATRSTTTPRPGAVTSIADITPSDDPDSLVMEEKLPRSGPADIPLLLGGMSGMTGATLYYYSTKRRLKRAVRNITIS